jgi:signal transduction histidine kinase
MSATSLDPGNELEQLAVVLERLPTGIVSFDGSRREVGFVNNAAQRLLHPARLRRRGPLPDPWPELSLPKYAERLIATGTARDTRVEPGADRVYLVSGVRTREETGCIILIDDISDRARRSRAEREFVANAAHELLTPLTGIVSAAHVLEAGAKDVPEDRDRFVAHIANECARLSRTARSLLVLARAQSGEEPPRLEIVRVCELLQEVVDHLGEARIEILCAETVSVLADADLFVQAAQNVVANAARHGPGDSVLIEVSEVGDSRVHIDVIATGAQLTAEDIGHLRRRFRSGGGRDSGGFGLGVSIAEQSLEVMGGRLALADSTGVVARMELPSGRVET